ncbi:hypothetical protein [Streptomyces turgidiscabies]|uniref:hypothetical protein n=1 Tax=Streptomyces turgidiscabies TaxID=85558 RepID=UPI0026882747
MVSADDRRDVGVVAAQGDGERGEPARLVPCLSFLTPLTSLSEGDREAGGRTVAAQAPGGRGRGRRPVHGRTVVAAASTHDDQVGHAVGVPEQDPAYVLGRTGEFDGPAALGERVRGRNGYVLDPQFLVADGLRDVGGRPDADRVAAGGIGW